MARRTKPIQAIGTRKKAIARATIREGKGIIRVNSKPLAIIQPEYVRLRISEPVVLAGNLSAGVDIDVDVRGGGVWGQADAARTAIANAFISWYGGKELKQIYTDNR